jgi:SAM-dependent methyltransferase
VSDPRAFFDALATRYERSFAPSHRDTARDLAPILERLREGDVVVDAGCGTGRAFPHLVARRVRVLGLDASSSMLQQAAARTSTAAVVRLRCDLAARWPLRDGVADAVLALHAVLAHPPHADPWAFFRRVGAEIARVGRRGALVAIDLPEPAWARASLEPLGGDWFRHFEPGGLAVDAFVPAPERVLEALGLALVLTPCATGLRALGAANGP